MVRRKSSVQVRPKAPGENVKTNKQNIIFFIGMVLFLLVFGSALVYKVILGEYKLLEMIMASFLFAIVIIAIYAIYKFEPEFYYELVECDINRFKRINTTNKIIFIDTTSNLAFVIPTIAVKKPITELIFRVSYNIRKKECGARLLLTDQNFVS